jgi:hypothetical protein
LIQGTFVALYKYILNALPLLNLNLNPPFRYFSSLPKHPATFEENDEEDVDIKAEAGVEMEAIRAMRTSAATRRLSTQAQAHQEWVRKRTKRWHAIVAGAIAGGLGLLFEKKRRRVSIAQQLFVRLVGFFFFFYFFVVELSCLDIDFFSFVEGCKGRIMSSLHGMV